MISASSSPQNTASSVSSVAKLTRPPIPNGVMTRAVPPALLSPTTQPPKPTHIKPAKFFGVVAPCAVSTPVLMLIVCRAVALSQPRLPSLITERQRAVVLPPASVTYDLKIIRPFISIFRNAPFLPFTGVTSSAKTSNTCSSSYHWTDAMKL
jgi:hypothetical protein